MRPAHQFGPPLEWDRHEQNLNYFACCKNQDLAVEDYFACCRNQGNSAELHLQSEAEKDSSAHPAEQVCPVRYLNLTDEYVAQDAVFRSHCHPDKT
jgi:hypothetical protein